ncbi:MAG: hypothetical protein ABIT83_01085 [Massilia sp.]
MSTSRRAAASDDSILARIERDASRKGGAGGARLALWLAAGATVVVLIGALAWLARENARVHKTVLQPSAALTAADAITRAAGAALPAPQPPAPQLLAAAIIDEPPETVRVPADPHAVLPPLVKLAPAKTVPAPDKMPTARAKTAPSAPVKAAPATSKPAPAPARSASVATPPAEPQTAAPARAAAHAPAPKVKKSPAPAEPEAAPVDSDVALLSAIIMNSSKHKAERAQAEADAESAPPPARKSARKRAPAAPKTTD